MINLLHYFKKAGGYNLLRQLWVSHVLLRTLFQFIALGRSKTSLELLDLAICENKKQKKRKEYRKILKQFSCNEKCSSASSENKTIWMLWWQDIETAPDIVKFCQDSIKENLKDWEIVVLSEKNYNDYVSLPNYVVEKKNKGIISLAHFADLIRLELLLKYGGLWIDSTVLCTGSKIPKSVMKSDLFVYQTQKPGANGRPTFMSNWLIYAKPNQKILALTLSLLYEYWKRMDYLDDYYIFHIFFTIACEQYPKDACKIPPFCNSTPHVLQLHLFDKYDEDFWNDLKRMTCFHKLTYKLAEKDMEKSGTYYENIIRNNSL